MKAITCTARTTCAAIGSRSIQQQTDCITRSLLRHCGSDSHILDGMIPTMERGDVNGHECMGEVVESVVT
jgi:threonine dehydrogenase-like Zn-dependent dehydrogenase